MNNPERLASLLGSKAQLAAVCQRSKPLISRWCREGRVPPEYNPVLKTHIAEQAPSKGEEWARQALGCLEPDVCECCGQRLN